jgi:putative SOS response-associated peptidase YedK
MCASTMQGQAAKTKFGDFKFKARTQGDFDEKIIYPLQSMAFGRLSPETGEREFVKGQFGLVPDWVTDAKGGTKFGRYCYNARSESVFEKPSFRKAILHKRAVIPVLAFYEFPDKEVPLKHRYRILRTDSKAMWLAGIWERNEAYGLESCSILTSEPMSLVSEFHSRSPIILDDTQLDAWLNPNVYKKEPIEVFLKPHLSDGYSLESELWNPKK